MKKIYLIFLIFLSFGAWAQVPSNDVCSNALAVALPGSGSICFNSSNTNATSDGIITCDTAGPGKEVWFTFIATNANNSVTVTPNGASPLSNVVVTLIASGCGSGTYDMCNSGTGTNPVTSTLGLVPGTQVWVSVESNGLSTGDFQVCINSTPPSSSPGDGCTTATNVCDKASMSYPDLSGFTASGVQPTCFAAPVRKDVWVKFTVGVTGTLEFLGTPIAADEYDWALYDVTSGCLGTLVSCNYNYASAGPFSCAIPGSTFGMLTTTTGQPCAAEFNAPVTVTAGRTYALLIDNYSQTNNGFTLDWGGTFEMGTTANFTASPVSSCSVPLVVTITNTSVGASSYLWNFGDGATSTSPNPGTHTYTSTGDYLISLVVTGNGCTSVMSKRINLNAGPVIVVNPPSASICPGDNVNLNGVLSLGTPYNDRLFSNNVNAAIPNNSAPGLTNAITSAGMVNTTLTTGSVQSICFTINHTDHSDIGRGPTPTAVQVTVNGNTYNFTPLPLPAVGGTATYCFPQTVLNAINAAGGNANTTWTLKVADNRGGGGGTGSLVSWAVTLRDFNSITGYTWSPTTNMINSTTLSPTVSPTANTTYTLTATDLFGCSTFFNVPITMGALPAIPTISTTAPTCSVAGSSTITNYNGALTYVFTPAGPSVGAGGLITGMTVGTNYTVTAGNGSCTSAASVSFSNAAVLPVPAIPTVSTSVSTCSSAGISTITNYNGALTYVFTPAGPTVGAGGLITGMTVGTSYTVTASNGSCSSASSVSFSNTAMLVTPAIPTISTTVPTCSVAGSSAITNYNGALTYVFTPAGPSVGAGGLITGMTVGTSYTVTAGNGSCTSAASVSFSNAAVLPVPAIPTVSTSVPTCSSAGISTITNYNGALTYVFTPAGPTVGAGGLITGMTIATSYTVVASNGSCSSASSVSFNNAAMLVTPAIPTISTMAPTCSVAGSSTITNYNGALTYVFTPAGPSVGAGGLITGMIVGTNYTVTAGNGSCTSVASVSFSNAAVLPVPAIPTVSTSVPTCSSAGISTITNYNGALTYVFTPAGPTVGAGGLITGMTIATSYTVTASNGSCSSASSVSFSNAAMLVTPAIPTISTTVPTCSVAGSSTITNYDGTLTYVFTPAGPSVGAGGLITGMTVGTNYTVTAGNGSCISAASVSFSNAAVLPVPAIPTVSTSVSTCSSDGISTITNYDGALTYVFTPAGPTVGAGGLITGMTVGTSYTVAAGNGSCTSTASVSFSNTAMLVTPAIPTISTTAPTCSVAGSSTITNYNGTLTYVFTPAGPSVGAGGLITGMIVGTNYTVTAGNGSCTSAASVSFSNAAVLPVPAIPTVSTSVPTCSSAGISTITNYNGALTYVFTPAGPTVGAGGLITGMTIATSYTVVASNGSCSSASSVSFSNAVMLVTPAIPTISTTAPTCSVAGNSTITNYDGTLTYVFTPAGPSVGAGGLITGMIVGTSYTVTAGNGSCTSAASVSFSNAAVLPVPAIPTVSTTVSTCSSDGISTITNYNGALTYVFTPAGPSVGVGGLITGMTVGTSYTVTAGNGSCTSTASVSFSNTGMLVTPAIPTISTTAPTCSVAGSSTITNYNGTLTYVFTPAGPSVGAGGLITGMTVGTSYTVTAGNGSCTSAASASFSNAAVLPVPAIPTVSTSVPTCSSDGISTITNYDGALTYVFTPAGPTVGAGGLITGMTIATSYTVTASNGSCSSASSVSFSNAAMLVTPAIPTISTTVPTCSVAGSSTITNYNGTLTYVFTPAGPSVGAGGLITGMIVGTSYTVTAGNGSCTSAASASFSNAAVLPVPAIPTVSTSVPTCSSDGISTITNYNGALTYVFTPTGPTVGAGGLITGMTIATSYTVVASNGSCSSASSVSFSNAAMLVTPAIPTISTTVPTCSVAGSSTITNYNGTLTYVFTPAGPSVGAGGLITGMIVGTNYTVTAGNGSCTSLASNSFVLDPAPTPMIIEFTGQCVSGSYTLIADPRNANYSYEWFDNAGISIGTSDTQVVTSSGIYTLEIDNGDGCISTITKEMISVICDIPKGVSPNGDGYNDSWNLEGVNAKSVKIFNRYGTTVYDYGSGYTNQWFGQSNSGSELPDGTYYYVIETGDGQTKTGWVYINRER